MSTWVFAPGELRIESLKFKEPIANELTYSLRNIFKLINSVNNHTNVFENEKKMNWSLYNVFYSKRLIPAISNVLYPNINFWIINHKFKPESNNLE